LKLLTDELSRIKHSADTLSEVDFADQPKRRATKVGEEVHSQFEAILEFAHANYDKKKISFRQDKKKYGVKRGGARPSKIKPRASKSTQVPEREGCPKHENELLRPTERISKKVIVDLTLTKNGVRKTITEYIGFQSYCPKCCQYYAPPDITKYGPNQLYGHRFKAWVVYHRVALRLSFESIVDSLDEQFNEKIGISCVPKFTKTFADYYGETEKIIIRHLLESFFIHVDETKVNIQGVN
jgi:hypothetical protein